MNPDLTPKQQTSEAIRQAETILIITGQHPSIDQVASTMALAAVLRKFGKKVTALISDSLPQQVSFLETGELDRNLSVRLARHRLSAAMHHLIERRLELVDDENLLVACKAAENLTEAYIGKPQSPKEALKEMQVQQKLEFLKELWTVGGVDSRLLTKNSGTGKYGFEDAIEAAQKAKQGPVK